MIRILEKNVKPDKHIVQFNLATTSQLYGFLEKSENEVLKDVREYYNIPHDKQLRLYLKVEKIAQNPDYLWESKVKTLYRGMLDLEKLMWNLATLGGAYSAMGDFDVKFAETAAKITEHQIRLARKFGDPSILARCYLYTALSDAQLGEMSRAVKTVKAIHYWSTNIYPSELVRRCSQGVYQKLVAIHRFGIQNNRKIVD